MWVNLNLFKIFVYYKIIKLAVCFCGHCRWEAIWCVRFSLPALLGSSSQAGKFSSVLGSKMLQLEISQVQKLTDIYHTNRLQNQDVHTVLALGSVLPSWFPQKHFAVFTQHLNLCLVHLHGLRTSGWLTQGGCGQLGHCSILTCTVYYSATQAMSWKIIIKLGRHITFDLCWII